MAMDVTFNSSAMLTHLTRILLAAILGALIGLERDIHGRAAGLRTNLLVSMGAAVFVILSEYIASFSLTIPGGTGQIADPGRIAAQVVTGIGFIGAGVILKEGFTVRGLTTAACLWIVAAVGMASGAGYYSLAIAATSIALVGLLGLHYVETFYRKTSYKDLTIGTTNNVEVDRIIENINGKGLKIISFDFERNYETGMTTFKFSARLFQKGIMDRLSQGIVKSLEQADLPLKYIKWGNS